MPWTELGIVGIHWTKDVGFLVKTNTPHSKRRQLTLGKDCLRNIRELFVESLLLFGISKSFQILTTTTKTPDISL